MIVVDINAFDDFIDDDDKKENKVMPNTIKPRKNERFRKLRLKRLGQ